MKFSKKFFLFSFVVLFYSAGFSSEISMLCSYGSSSEMYQLHIQFKIEEEQIRRSTPLTLKGAMTTFSKMSSRGWQPLQKQFVSNMTGSIVVDKKRLVLVSAQSTNVQMSFSNSFDSRFHSGVGSIFRHGDVVRDAECSSFLILGPRPGFTVSN
jgi:hypothetical protein